MTKTTKATKTKKNKLLDTWTGRCPHCNKKHSRDLPSDGDYVGLGFSCCADPDIEVEEGEEPKLRVFVANL